jgi:hypothetical protein
VYRGALLALLLADSGVLHDVIPHSGYLNKKTACSGGPVCGVMRQASGNDPN